MPEQPIIPGLEDYQKAKEEEIAKADEAKADKLKTGDTKKIVQKPAGVQMTIDKIPTPEAEQETSNKEEKLSPGDILRQQAEELKRRSQEDAEDDDDEPKSSFEKRKDIFG